MPKVKDVLEKKGPLVVTVSEDVAVLEAAKRMRDKKIGSVVVVAGDQVIGIFTERDVLYRVVAEGRNPAHTRIGEVMTRPVAVCRPTTPLAECEVAMTQKRLRRLPVVDDGRLVGLVSIGDILAWRADAQATTIEYLQEYLHGRV